MHRSPSVYLLSSLAVCFALIAVLSAVEPVNAAGGGGGYASRMSAVDASREALESEVVPFRGCVVDEIIVEGNAHTERRTIIREMATREGGQLDADVLYRDHSYLRGLGFFSEVEIKVDETSPGHCKVVVTVSERPDLFMKYPYPALRYDLIKGVSYGVHWKVRNFRGKGQELFVGFDKRRGHEHGASAAWSMPWVGDRRMRLSFNIYSYEKLKSPASSDYLKEKYGGGVMMGFPLTRSLLRQVWIMPDISLESRNSRLDVEGSSDGIGVYTRQMYLITGLTLTYDSRDNLTSPFRGAFAGARVRRYTSVEGMRQQYSVMSLVSSFYVPVKGMGSLIFAFAGDNRDGDVPWFYQVGIGGDNELRGYDDGDERANTRLLTTIQWRRNVFGPHAWDIPLIGKFDVALNTVAFVDNGALMSSLDMAPRTKFHSTAGFGIEIISPIQDLVRLEVAFSPDGAPSYFFATGNRF